MTHELKRLMHITQYIFILEVFSFAVISACLVLFGNRFEAQESSPFQIYDEEIHFQPQSKKYCRSFIDKKKARM